MFEQISIPWEIAGEGSSMLICADGSQPHQALAELAGAAQVVYLDPPFMTGDVFMRRRRFGERGWRTGSPSPEYMGYEDHFADRNEYLKVLRGLIENAWMLLNPTGMLCLHLDWRSSAYGRLICNELFGEDRFINEIVWAYESGGRAKKYFSRKHDVILMYAKSRNYHFDLSRVPLDRTETRRNHLRKSVDEDGRAYRSVKVGGKEYRYYDDEPVYPGDVWTDISHLQQRDPERTGYVTQKPLRLLDRLLRPLTRPDDLVVDLCCGSGTTLVAARDLGCRYLGMDTSQEAINLSLNRLGGGDVQVEGPCADEPAALTGSYTPLDGLLMLDGFNARHKAFPKPDTALDPLESWSAGMLRDGVLYVQQSFRRTYRQPQLPTVCVLTPEEGQLAVSTVDAAGRRRVYRWVD